MASTLQFLTYKHVNIGELLFYTHLKYLRSTQPGGAGGFTRPRYPLNRVHGLGASEITQPG